MNEKNIESIQHIIKSIEDNQSFIIFNHMNPDGDAVGSQLALYMVLNRMGKITYLFSSQEIFPEYRFLPHIDEIKMELPTNRKFDVAIMLDCASPDRIGSDIEVELTQYKQTINIDHHISNKRFGTLNWVRPESSSTGELIYELMKEMGCPIDADIATCLYTAIFTDTGGFRHSNTSHRTLGFAAELVDAGAKPHVISREVYASFPERRLHLLGKALETLRIVEEGRAAFMWVYTDYYEQTGSTIVDADEFVEFPRSLGGVDIAFVFKEITANAAARVNFRSNNPRCNVNRIASAFGGGGHAEASACNIDGTRKEIERRVLKAVCNELIIAYTGANEQRGM